MTSDELPYFLQSWDNLFAHFDEHFPESSNERGDAFVVLAQRIIPVTEQGRTFPKPELSENKSHDGGVDIFTTKNEQGQELYAQSKFRVRSKDDFDTIISKFANYESKLMKSRQPSRLFGNDENPSTPPTFMIVTSSKLEGIKQQYLASDLSSKPFYKQLIKESRLIEVDDPKILTLLQTLYRQSHHLPNDVRLTSTSGWISEGNVRLGTVKAQDLIELYDQHGSALFFENIRDFLGLTSGKKVEDRVTVNAQIVDTVKNEPQKMLERNNGVTFRAVNIASNDAVLTLNQAAIVNGCQTTMCIVNSAPVDPQCLVQVKVVITENGWEIATAANYQNPVTLIELDLARYLRPQLVKKAATDLGYGYEKQDDSTITGVLNSIYQRKVDYEEMRLLYLALFSIKPSNLFESLYTKLLGEVLHRLYADEKSESEIFATLFLLLTKAREAFMRSEQAYSGAQYAATFKRFRQEDKPSYRIYLAILAACGATLTNLSERLPDSDAEAKRLMQFLKALRQALETKPQEFTKAYLYAFQVLAETALEASSGDDGEVSQSMFRKVSQAAFSVLFQKLLLRLDSERIVREIDEAAKR